MARNDLTAERLRDLIDYNKATGIFTWRIARRGCGLGKVAGCFDISSGYVMIKIDRNPCLAHRLAFLWMNGIWPNNQVDHKDKNRSNNRWLNLRQATQKQNNENMSMHTKNTSGYNGVHWAKRHKQWVASIGHNGKKYFLGMSKDINEAIAIRRAGELKLFTHSPACGQSS